MTVDPGLSDALIDTVRRYTRDRLVPIELQLADDDRIAAAVLADFRALGLFGLTIPTDDGGQGLGMAEEAELMMELAWSSAAFRSIVGVHFGLGSEALLMQGTDEQKAQWLPPIASGEAIVSFCLSEPGSSADSAALLTRADLDGADYILNGAKRLIANAPQAGLFVVMARTAPERLPKNAHVTAFLVPADTPGIEIGKSGTPGARPNAWTSDVVFNNVRVPATAIVGGVAGKGFASAMKSLDRGRIHIASIAVGQARRILDEATRHAADQQQFGEAAGPYQLVQSMLAEGQADLYAAESMLRDVARRYDRGERVSLEASCAKMFCTEMVGRIADRAVQIHGAAHIQDSAVERLHRDVQLFRIHEGTTQTQQLSIGRELVRRIEYA